MSQTPAASAQAESLARVDWSWVQRTGERTCAGRPEMTAPEIEAVVQSLRDAARASAEPVAETAQLQASEAPPALVVDRPAWIQANIQSMRRLFEPLLPQPETNPSGGLSGTFSGAASGAQLGAVLGFLSQRVLGQYDPMAEPGRLLLVAPNIVKVQRELGVNARDFQFWVCLHEETHRVQFSANPWLAGHLQEEIRALLRDSLASGIDMGAQLTAVIEQLRGGKDITPVSILRQLSGEEAAQRFERINAVMSLLEGHADVVMDDVGPKVIPTVRTIRRKFNQRRNSPGPVDRIARKFLGLEAKAQQYRQGAKFVRQVQREVGVAGFNQVFSAPETLPTAAEIQDPQLWVQRVG